VIIVVMGVTGAGKTAVGRLLAEELRWEFADGDDFHPAANVERMRRGAPLSDDVRRPWLETLREEISQRDAEGRNLVLACSALKKNYRTILAVSEAVKFVYLKGEPAQIAERLRMRRGHFADEKILAAQFADLEEPENAVVADIAATPQEIVSQTPKEIRDITNRGDCLTRELDRNLESAVVSRLMWRLMPFLFLLYIVAYLDRINVSFAILQMREPLHLIDRVYGRAAGIFFAGYFFFQVPSNMVLEKSWSAALEFAA